MQKQTPIWKRRARALNALSMGAFVLVSLIFVYLLYYGQTLSAYSSPSR